LEENYLDHLFTILNQKVPPDSNLLLLATQWHDKTQGFGDARRATASVEKWSTEFLDTYCST
jgi:hypothetical protein